MKTTVSFAHGSSEVIPTSMICHFYEQNQNEAIINYTDLKTYASILSPSYNGFSRDINYFHFKKEFVVSEDCSFLKPTSLEKNNPSRNVWPRVKIKTLFFIVIFLVLVAGLHNEISAQISQRGTATFATTTNTTLTINKPAGVVAGDVMIVNITQTGNTTTNASLSGWTLIAGAQQSTGSPRRSTVLYRKADGTEGTSFTFSLGTGTTSAVGSIIAFSGVDAAVFDVTPGTLNTGADTPITVTGISTTTNNVAIVFLAGAGGTDGSIYSAWSGTNPTFTEVMDFSTTTSHNSVGTAWGTLATAGATGNKTVTIDGNYYWAGILIALRPAPLTSP